MPVDMFLDFTAGPSKGGSLPPITVIGETLDKTYPKTLAISAFDFSVENPTSLGSASGGAGTGKAKFNEFKVTKPIDAGSPALFQALASGAHFPAVRFIVRKAGTTTGYLIYTFSMVFITAIEGSMAASGEVPEETVQFAYGALQVSYTPSSGSPAGSQPLVSVWNQVTNSANPNIPGN